ncbi:uncharacterized protein LOC112052255 [Bicyclus anynana]|uniref:Uncharacterized protein LOC112052255 n=1 Tax=Bicyclus anynana TaxID=110368 RepID=A0ABM3LWJ6_BICAN|nr:uncharacterized protein LOC112052255 [Bicyclus anynana]
MLRQAIYVTQGRMRELEPLLEEHRQQTALRMAFMFNRLQQLAEDMRRIYTLSQRKQYQFRMFYQLTWHTHVVRKYLDVLYTVEHVIRTHAAFVEPLKMELEKMGMAVDG